MSFAKRLAVSVVSSDLESQEGKIHAIEHVASLAGATAIGSDMFRARDYDVNALRRAVLLLARQVRQRLRLGMGPSYQLANAAIMEVMHWQCRQCAGASEQIIGGVRMTCPACGGTGVHRWSDKERARATGYEVETWHAWAGKYEVALGMAAGFNSQTVADARARLG